MLKTIHLPNKIVMLLLAGLLIIINSGTVVADEGEFLFRKNAFLEPGSLAVKLQDTRVPLSKFLVSRLSAETQQLLTGYDGINLPSSELLNLLLTDLNRLLQEGSLYNEQYFASIPLSEQTQKRLAQNPQIGEDLLCLNRFLLADAYPYELAVPFGKQMPENSKRIETCRENLQQIKLALENYYAEADTEPQWLSELSPRYLDKKFLLCPSDATRGKPGVLTEDAEDPGLPCSYLYEFRPEQKGDQESLLQHEGDMLPIVRCQHHLLNLSVSGKLYRNGPQRDIYNKTARIVKKFSIQMKSAADLVPQTTKQMEEEHLKGDNGVKGMKGVAIFRLDNNSGDLQAQLKEQLGEAFLESPEGKALLNQLTPTSPASTTNLEEFAHLLGKPMPDIALTDLSKNSVKLKTFLGKFILLHIFSIDSDDSVPKLQHLEKLLKNDNVSQLQTIGISLSGSIEAIEAFKEKHQLSMLVWVDKDNHIQTFLSRDVSKSQAELITLLLNPELVVKDVLVDFAPESILQKVKALIESENE